MPRVEPIRWFCTAAAVCGLLSASCGRTGDYYRARADRHYQAGEFVEASLNYGKALQKKPDDAAAAYGLALSAERRGLYRDAHQALRTAVRLSPDHLPARIRLGEIAVAGYVGSRLTNGGLRDEAHEQIDRLVASEQHRLDGLRLAARLALAEGRHDDARKSAEAANEIEPLEPEVVLLWVQALLRSSREAEAVEIAGRSFDRGDAAPALYDVLYAWYIGRERLSEAEAVLRRKAEDGGTAEARIDLARHYAAAGRPGDAQREIDLLLNAPERYPGARLAVGDLYVGFGQVADALEQFEAGARDAADSEERLAYLRRSVRSLAQMGRLEDAAERIGDLLNTYPDDADLLETRALVRSLSPDRETRRLGIEDLRQIQRSQPRDPDAARRLAAALVQAGDRLGAIAELRRTAAWRTDDAVTRSEIAGLLIDEGRPAEALEEAEIGLLASPGYPGARLVRAAALREMGRAGEAEREIAALARALPGDPRIEMEAARVDLAQGRLDRAESVFRKYHRAGGRDIAPLAGLARVLAAQGRTAEAERLVREALKESPSRSALRVLLAETLSRGGDFDEAVEEYRRAAGDAPDSALIAVRLGTLLAMRGNQQGALLELQRAVELDPGATVAWDLIARLHVRSGQPDEAVRAYRQWLKAEPASVAAANNLAYLLAEEGELSEAAALASRAVELAPDAPEPADTLGWVYMKQGQVPAALNIFARLASAYPQKQTYRSHHGLALLEAGRNTEAVRELRGALELDDRSPEADRIRAALARAERRE